MEILRNENGMTLIELLVVVALISIVAVLAAPEIGRFNSNSQVRECATDLIQNMRIARAMAIKENREYLMVFDTANQRYLIGFDGDGDNDLTTLNGDTFGICNDTKIFDINGDGDFDDDVDRGDGIPDTDSDANGDGVPDCVRVVNLTDCGDKVRFGTLAPNGPGGTGDDICSNGEGVCFGNTLNPIRADFNPDGSAGNIGSVYLEHDNDTDPGRGYSYIARISSNAAAMSMWKWDGDIYNQSEIEWTEIR